MHTYFHADTPDKVIHVLEAARHSRQRIHISYGDAESGRDWLEEYEVHGYVGRSTGKLKVPLLLPNRRSIGGGAILDHCIVRIRTSAGGRVLYQHPSYHFGAMEIRNKPEAIPLSDGRELKIDLLCDQKLHASFQNMKQVRHWIRKLGVIAAMC